MICRLAILHHHIAVGCYLSGHSFEKSEHVDGKVGTARLAVALFSSISPAKQIQAHIVAGKTLH
jgi:hypothetical protein